MEDLKKFLKGVSVLLCRGVCVCGEVWWSAASDVYESQGSYCWVVIEYLTGRVGVCVYLFGIAGGEAPLDIVRARIFSPQSGR